MGAAMDSNQRPSPRKCWAALPMTPGELRTETLTRRFISPNSGQIGTTARGKAVEPNSSQHAQSSTHRPGAQNGASTNTRAMAKTGMHPPTNQ